MNIDVIKIWAALAYVVGSKNQIIFMDIERKAKAQIFIPVSYTSAYSCLTPVSYCNINLRNNEINIISSNKAVLHLTQYFSSNIKAENVGQKSLVWDFY